MRLSGFFAELVHAVGGGPKSNAIGSTKVVRIVFSIVYYSLPFFLVLAQVQVKSDSLS